MRAFHSDKKIKAKYLERVMQHELADEIIKGKYWENGKGCAVGCTIHSGNHQDYETELGIPRILARLEDGIFENIPDNLSKSWPKRFLQAIKPGADLSGVWPAFAVWLLRDEIYGVLQFAKTEAQQDSINSVADLYELKLEGIEIDPQDFRDAADAADAATAATATATAAYAATAAAAAYAAYAATAAAAAYAAYAATAATAADAAAYAAAYAATAADADAYAAAYAAYAAAYAAYAATAATAATAAKRIEWRIAQSEKLLELLKTCK